MNTLVSPLDFDATVRRLGERLTAAGMTLFTTIDHAANAREVGLSMPPATVLIYGNPRGGTPLMLAAPAAALELPLRVLVQQHADGKVLVVWHPIVATLVAAGVPEDLAARLEPAQAVLGAALAP